MTGIYPNLKNETECKPCDITNLFVNNYFDACSRHLGFMVPEVTQFRQRGRAGEDTVSAFT